MPSAISDLPKTSACRKFFAILSIGAYIAVFGYIFCNALIRPTLNCDMLGYIGRVIAFETSDPQAIHDRTFAEIKPVVSPGLYEAFHDREPIVSYSDKFYEWLPFSSVKPLYVGAVWLLHKIGAGLAQATWLVSALSFAVLGITLACWRPRAANYDIWLWGIIGLCLLGRQPLASLAPLSTPDAFSLMWIMLAFMTWDRWKSTAAYAVCALLSVLARPDALLPLVVITAYFTLCVDKEQRLKPFVSAFVVVAGITIYFVIFAVAGIGWKEIFYVTLINIRFDFMHLPIVITWEQYRDSLLNGLHHEAQFLRVPFFAALSLLALFCHYMFTGNRHQWMWLLLMTWAAFAAKFLLFPVYDERYYYAYFLLLLMTCLELISPFLTIVCRNIKAYRQGIRNANL